MNSKRNIYIIDGNELLFALLNEDPNRWYTDIKLLKNLDKAINYISEQLSLYFRRYEPTSKAVILLDKPIRESFSYKEVKIKFISDSDITQDLKYEIESSSGRYNLYLISKRDYLNKDTKFKELNYIDPKDFINRLMINSNDIPRNIKGIYDEPDKMSSLITADRIQTSFKSISKGVEDIIEVLREPNIDLIHKDIIEGIKDSFFAIHFIGKSFPLSGAAEYVKVRPIIYVGYAYGGGALRRLVTDDSSKSNVRQLIGIILKDKEVRNVEIIPVARNDFKFDNKSEWRITDWIKQNFKVSLFLKVKDSFALSQEDSRTINQIKYNIVRELSPVLNLTNNPGNPYGFELKQMLKKVNESRRSDDSPTILFSRSFEAPVEDFRKYDLRRNLKIINDQLSNFDNLDTSTQKEIFNLLNSYQYLNNLFQYYYSTETKSRQRDLFEFISEKEEKTVKEEWERIIDEMAHSINTDVYAALSYLNQGLENDLIKKASINVQQIRDITNLIMWYLKRSKLKLSGNLQSVSLIKVIQTQIDTIKAGIHTLRLTTAEHRDSILEMKVDFINVGQDLVQIDSDLVTAINLILKDVLRNALKNTDETEPKVTIQVKEGINFILVTISNNLLISREELEWFNYNIENSDLQMSKSSKVGLRLVKKWCKYLKIESSISIDNDKKITSFSLKFPKEVKVEESA